MTKKKKKSLTGWTNIDWYRDFRKCHPNWLDRVFHGAIMTKPVRCFADIKVRITIEEL